MILFFKRAVRDIRTNRFLNVVTIITISLSILIVSSLALFFVNAGNYMGSWQKGIRIIAYLKPDLPEAEIVDIKNKIQGFQTVASVDFISKQEAMKKISEQMKQQSSLFEDLKENPLPDAFEVYISGSSLSNKQLENLAKQIESIPEIDFVEYGKKWIGRFVKVFELFRLTGYAMSGIFFIASVFIVANTIRLVIYSRSEEIEIMRLVGATDSFIKTPFYIQGLIQGALGGILGLASLFVVFMLISSNIKFGLSSDLLYIKFLSLKMSIIIICCSMLAGWLGCFISLRQFLKR